MCKCLNRPHQDVVVHKIYTKTAFRLEKLMKPFKDHLDSMKIQLEILETKTNEFKQLDQDKLEIFETLLKLEKMLSLNTDIYQSRLKEFESFKYFNRNFR